MRVEAKPSGACLLLEGEPGIGRSAMLGAAVQRARAADVRVLSLNAAFPESDPSLRLVNELLADLPPAGLPDTATLDELVLGALRHAGQERPTVVAIDNANAVDDRSWDALTHAARQLHDEPLTLLLALPAGDARARRSGLITLALGPLTREASAEVLDDIAPGSPTFVRQRILDAAAGNPLALHELAGASHEEWRRRCVRPPVALPVTPRLMEAFAEPVHELSATAQEVLLAAAANDADALGEAARAAAATRGCSVEEALTASLVAVQHHVVESDGVMLRFRSEASRSAIYQASDPSRRRALHLAFADILGHLPARRAWHQAAASLEPDEALAAELERASHSLRRRGLIRDALANMDRAARVSTDADAHARRLLAAAEMGFEMGRPDFAATFTEQAGHLAETPARQREVSLLRGLYDLWRPDQPEALITLLERAERASAAGDDLTAQIALTRAIEKVEVLPADAVPRHALNATATRLGGVERTPALAGVLTAALPTEFGAATVAVIARSAPDADGNDRLARLLGASATILGHDALAIRSLSASIDGLRARGRFGFLPFALIDRARAYVNSASLDLARADASEAGTLATESDQHIVLGRVRAVQALIEGIAGRPQAARQLADEAERLTADRPALLVDVHLARGLSALVEGEHEAAYASLMRLWQPNVPVMADSRRRTCIGDLAEAAVVCGEADAVRPLVHQLSVAAAAMPSPALRSGVAHARAVLATPSEDASELFVRARSVAADHGPLSAARVHLSYGVWLRRARRVSEARMELRSAVALFDQIGAQPWSARARAELRAAGSTTVGPAAVTEELTAQERQIAELAGAGLTNREIGARLFLSHRTVSTHLYRVFPKLGITSRGQLRDALVAAPGAAEAHA